MEDFGIATASNINQPEWKRTLVPVVLIKTIGKSVRLSFCLVTFVNWFVGVDRHALKYV